MHAPRLIQVDPAAPDLAQLAPAAALLRKGGLVAFPTETVYGLGADARNPAAVARIFESKGRPATNPLIVHVADVDAARAIAATWPPIADRLAAAFWPGPLTLLLPKRPEIPDLVTAGLGAVGVRIPAHPVALALLKEAGIPVAAPSANPYMGISPTEARHVLAGLGDRVDAIVDGGSCAVGIESTVLDLTGEVPTVLRPGGVSLDAIRRIAPEARMAHLVPGEGPQASPGLARRHYAPKAPLSLIDGREALVPALAAAGGGPVAVLTIGPAPAGLTQARVHELPRDPEGYAAALYATLHALDAQGVSRILVERPPETDAWTAVRDRLGRAAER
ncbi:threonylcarbamoyl-AMP synthase [bacterium]|nr:threonylcarbamoyl-AMP synthase [bacterium]